MSDTHDGDDSMLALSTKVEEEFVSPLTAIRGARAYRGDKLIRTAKPHAILDPANGIDGRVLEEKEGVRDVSSDPFGDEIVLSRSQAEHLTRNGAIRNEDGTWSWKFDPHLHAWPPEDLPEEKLEELWGRISCPTLLVYGNDSWASNPEKDGRIKHFGDNVKVSAYDRAGHWVHHDRFEDFTSEVKGFIG